MAGAFFLATAFVAAVFLATLRFLAGAFFFATDFFAGLALAAGFFVAVDFVAIGPP